MTISQKYSGYKNMVEKSIQEHIDKFDCVSPKLSEAIKYSLLSKGKRLRPVLFLAAYYHFYNKKSDSNLMDQSISDLCFAIEALHTYTLIHDDLPCMDNDDERRGLPSCHKKYNEAHALLAGDALLNLSFESALNAIKINPKFIDAVGYFFDKTGINGVVAGQSLEFETKPGMITQELLLTIMENKTAALFKAAITMGGMCADLSYECIKQLEAFGYNYGMAFQLKDDLQDLNELSFARKFGQEKTKKLFEMYYKNANNAANQLNSEFFLFILQSLIK